jgi:hypothetical protein
VLDAAQLTNTPRPTDKMPPSPPPPLSPRWRDIWRSIKPLCVALCVHWQGEAGHMPGLIRMRRDVQKQVCCSCASQR